MSDLGALVKTEAQCNYTLGAEKSQISFERARSKMKYRVEYALKCQSGMGSSVCTGTAYRCPDGLERSQRRIFGAMPGQSERILSENVFCNLGDPPLMEGIDAEDAPIVVTTADVQNLGIAPSTVGTEANGFTLINAHTNVWAESGVQNFTTTILDTEVRVRVSPTAYQWSYGDGTSKTTDSPGRSLGGYTTDTETDTSHQYSDTGTFNLGLTTVYQAEYSVEGGPWQAVVGTNQTTSPSVPIDVWRSKKILVDMDCTENPSGPGCDSPFEE